MVVVKVKGSYHITYIYSSTRILQDEYDHQADALVTAATISNSKLDISADGRCDSPRHCVLYGVVSFMELNPHKHGSDKGEMELYSLCTGQMNT